jgi:hypothetical protein
MKDNKSKNHTFKLSFVHSDLVVTKFYIITIEIKIPKEKKITMEVDLKKNNGNMDLKLATPILQKTLMPT